MTQPSRTTETINRDNAAIRDIMHQIRDLTVPDRATLALGLVGHLATMMNRSQMTKLMNQLQEEAERVQDVPPIRQRDADRDRESEELAAGPAGDAQRTSAKAEGGSSGRQESGGNDGGVRGEPRDQRAGAGQFSDGRPGKDGRGASGPGMTRPEESGTHEGVGQGGRGEFRSRKLL